VGAKNNKILLFVDQCAAHLKTPIFLDIIRVVFVPVNYTSQLQSLGLRIIHAFMCNYRKQLIWKTVVMMNGGLLQVNTQMKLDVQSAMHFTAEPRSLITPTTVMNCFVKHGSSTDHVSSNDSVVKRGGQRETQFITSLKAV
jgi:hypothetical protein